MTEYVIREAGPRHWLVFADRKCIGVCVEENEAEKLMNDYSARVRRSQTSRDIVPKAGPPVEIGG